jgi:hypothetical protein
MTIHKNQGQTLDRAVVDIDRAFEGGQIYVALSRVKSISGLVLDGGAQRLRLGVSANREVVRFYRDTFPGAGGGSYGPWKEEGDCVAGYPTCFPGCRGGSSCGS